MPYLFAAFIWVIPITEILFHISVKDIIKTYILCVRPSQLWFLWMLFWIFLIEWPLQKVAGNHQIITILVSLVLYVVGYVCGKYIWDIFCIWDALQYLIIFQIGILINKYKGITVISKVPAIVWMLMDIVLYALSMSSRYYVLKIFARFLLRPFGAFSAFIVLHQIVAIKKCSLEKNKIVNSVCELSMPIYLFHQQVIYFVILFLNGRVTPWIIAPVNFACAFGVSYCISKVLARYKITGFFIGKA